MYMLVQSSGHYIRDHICKVPSRSLHVNTKDLRLGERRSH